MKFQLEKGVEKTKFVLAKKNVSPTIRAQVAANLDVSGSTRGLFSSGQMQEAFQRVMPIGVTFDDNGEIDVFLFTDGSSACHLKPTASKANYDKYINESVLHGSPIGLWGGTSYAPVIKKNLEEFGFYKGIFSKSLQSQSKSNMPVVVYFFTDGENDDQSATRKILQECQDAKCNIYFLFIGVGTGCDFKFLKKIGDEFTNTGFLSVADLNTFQDDDKIYDALLPQELCGWLTK